MARANLDVGMPGFEEMLGQQQFHETDDGALPGIQESEGGSSGDDLDDIKKQLAELQDKLSKMNK